MRLGTYYRLALIKKLKLDEYIKSLDKWLDIGCYDGTILQAIDAREKIGIDLETKKQRNIHIIKASVECLPFKNGSIKIITAFDVLEHIKKDSQMINQMKQKLTNDGSLILTVPHNKEKIFPKLLKNWLIFHKWKHIRIGYDKNSLKKLFKGNWKLKFIYWNTDISNLSYFSLQLIWKVFQKFGRAIINKLIEIEFIRTKKYYSKPGHIVLIAKRL